MILTTLEKIKRLERIYEEGYSDEFIDKTLDKILDYELYKTQENLKTLQKDLAELEGKYKMTSKDFFEKFQKGEMPDTAEFMEWNCLYKMYINLEQRIKILREGSSE
jgi:hypothetical protein